MTARSFKALVLGLSLSALCSLALAAGDAGVPKLPTTPPNPVADKSPRCLPATVNECRQACESKKFDSSDKKEAAKKQNECKQDCIRGC